MNSRLHDAVQAAAPLYILPKDALVAEALVPAFKACTTARCMMGYFSSRSLAELAPGLAAFLHAGVEPLQLVISPFVTASDKEALSLDPQAITAMAEEFLLAPIPDEWSLERHALKCLAWLVHDQRLQLKFAILRNSLFHPKAWLFAGDGDTVAVHGSSNMTRAGLTQNREQVTVSRSWIGDEQRFHIARLQTEFETLWSGGDDDCVVYDLPEALANRLLREYKGTSPPDEGDFDQLWLSASALREVETADDNVPGFAIPKHLKYDSGPFAHQGDAVRSWFAAQCRGILEMATGSGKTIAALVAAHELWIREGRLLVVIAAPYRPLLEQWLGELAAFSLAASYNLSTVGGPAPRSEVLATIRRGFKYNALSVAALVVSNVLLASDDLLRELASIKAPKLIIADECHNLGASRFISVPDGDVFQYRLGLSATPVRQYDEVGTRALETYFGQVCFRFTLDDAIGVCLTPYDYYAHFVDLSADEMERWSSLTREISRFAWKLEANEPDSHLEKLLRDRRLILENAESKIAALRRMIGSAAASGVRDTLIYATDKDPAQLRQVNDLLNESRILFHQLTYEETCSRQRTNQILTAFKGGQLQVLTAKRVLDEGVDIPTVRTAYVLASTTVRRQWVQRRGRLLRKSPGKEYATIHDFVVIPSIARFDAVDRDGATIIEGELARVWEFARLSRNAAADDGGFKLVESMRRLLDNVSR